MTASQQMVKKCALVHGAWHGSWSWQNVIPHLEQAGFEVTTFTLPGVGERADEDVSSISFQSSVNDLVARLNEHYQDEPYHLVGHSLGGAISVAAADQLGEQRDHLILLDCVFLDDGECLFTHVDPESAEHQPDKNNPLVLAIPSATMFGIEDPNLLNWVQEKLTPHPIGMYKTPVSLNHSLDSLKNVIFIHYTDPESPLIKPFRDKAAVLGWQVHNIPRCHDALITHPEETAELIAELTTI